MPQRQDDVCDITREKSSSRLLEGTEKMRTLQMKFKSREMGIYEVNGVVKGLPGSLLHTLHTNSINLTDEK